MTDPLEGRRLGEFIVREELSRGGFGVVFRAEQPALAREAVIKVLHTRLRASENLIARFLREARLASRLDHPYAAHIYAFGAEPDGVLWIAMELVRGTPLDKLLLAQGALSLERFVPLLERICQVVQTAHDQGIVHRDIKPGNVMVLARAGQLLPKLLDLGIAKLDVDGALAPAPRAMTATDDTDQGFAETVTLVGDTPSDAAGRLTEEGAIMGSPLYMAPEQWADAGAVDARTDIYALGVLCHEALTTRPPFSAGNRFAIATLHATASPPPLGAGFPPALDDVVARALAKRPEDRYASALEFAAAFKVASGILDEPSGLPRLPEELRQTVLARAPQPVAQALGILEAARNAHQARDAVWQLVRVVARLVGVTALSAHSHVGAGGRINDSGINEALRWLRRRTSPDADWIALAGELCAPFVKLRDAYPIPELIDFVTGPTSASLVDLVTLHDSDDVGASDDHVRAQLTVMVPLVESLLQAIAFFDDYRLVVPDGTGADLWMGVRRNELPRLTLRGAPLVTGQPAFVDASGLPVISLWPFLQLREPTPGVPDHLFFFEGKGRRGARLVALPEAFEVEDSKLWDVVGGLVRAETDVSGGVAAVEVSPFPGLSAFTADDANRFFGREREAEAFVNRLRVQPLLAVVGPSGAGKSSFIHAGVAPRLPPGTQVVSLRPGAMPMLQLVNRLAVLGFDPQTLGDELRQDPSRLGALLRTRVAPDLVVIVVDQLEEVFTLCEDVAERARFVDVLVRTARAVDDPVRVVFTMRDDFLLHAEALPALRARLAQALHLLTTPNRDDLLRILLEPLRQVGYELDDPSLAGEMVDALAGTRSALALLSFTASKLWDLRDRRFRQLSRRAYASLGGVGGALAKHAEATLAEMAPEEQRLVREVFRQAVTAEGTRAVSSRAELDQVLGGGVYAKTVVEKLVAARLLVGSESATGGEQVEVTHEALIDAWPRLVTWRREDAEGARLRDQLRIASRQWEDRGRASGLLWRGDALAEYRLWRARFPGLLTELETAFAAASLGDAARATRRRTWSLAALLVVLTMGVIALVFLNTRASRQRTRAEESQAVAELRASEARDATARLRAKVLAQYSDQGRRAVVGGDMFEGLTYLANAHALGARGPAYDLLVAAAARVVKSRLRFVEHAKSILCARFSPDGARFVTCGNDNRARVWRTDTGALLVDLPHAGPVVRAEFVGDGLLLTASRDGTASLWDAATGQRRQVFAAGDDLVGIAASPDQRWIVTITADDLVKLWVAATGELHAVLEPRADTSSSLVTGSPCAFTPDSTQVAVGDHRGVVRVWSTATGALVATASGHTDQINSLKFGADGRQLLSSSSDHTAALWDARTGRRLQLFQHAKRVNAAELSPDGRLIATASNDHTAMLWDAGTGERRFTLTGHTAGVNRVVFRADGKQLATGADDATGALWDVATGRRYARLLGHGAAINDVSYAPQGDHLLTASEDYTAIVWSTVPQDAAVRLTGHRGTVYSVDFSPDGTRLVTGGQDGTTRVWDRATGAEQLVLHQVGEVRRALFSPDGRLVATAGADATIHLWDARTGAPVRQFTGHTQPIFDLAWHPDGSLLVSASRDGTARVVSLTTPAVTVFRGHGEHLIFSAAFSSTGTSVVTTSEDNETRMWDPKTGVEQAHWPDLTTMASASFDRTNQLLVGATFLAVAKVWRVATGAKVADLLGHAGNIMDTAWSPDGAFVVTASIDGTSRIWDAQHGEMLAVFQNESFAQMWSARYAHDGRYLATGADDGSVMIWRLPEPAPPIEDLIRCYVPLILENNLMVRIPLPKCT